MYFNASTVDFVSIHKTHPNIFDVIFHWLTNKMCPLNKNLEHQPLLPTRWWMSWNRQQNLMIHLIIFKESSTLASRICSVIRADSMDGHSMTSVSFTIQHISFECCLTDNNISPHTFIPMAYVPWHLVTVSWGQTNQVLLANLFCNLCTGHVCINFATNIYLQHASKNWLRIWFRKFTL
jgi:hypothetical protein